MATFLIFLATCAVAVIGRAPGLRVDRAGAAIIGAVLMVLTGAIGFDEAVRAIDFRTLALLFGMMVLVAHVRLSGGLTAPVRVLGRRGTHPLAVLLALVFVTGGLSALFLNSAICLVLTPLVVDIAEARRHRPLPYLVAVATASNIGSVATVIGNPQNMLIGSVSGVGFRTFSAALAPVALIGLALDALLVWLIFRPQLRTLADGEALPQPDDTPVHAPVLIKAVIVTAGMLTGFLMGYDTALVSAAGVAALLTTRRVSPARVYAAIDWDLLMLFCGFFVIVAAAARAGIDRRLFSALAPFGLHTVAGLSAATAILGAAVSTVPGVMVLTRLVPDLADPGRSWLTIAMASTFAGNLTIIGSTATLIVAEGARRRGVEMGFWAYSKVGIPLTILTLAVGVWWLS